MESFEEVLKQYTKNISKFPTNEEKLKKHFITLLLKGSPGEQRRIRILPTKDGTTPFKEVYYHEIEVDGKWLKLWDPKNENKRSPLNELKEKLEKSPTESERDLAKNYRSRKYYIVKVIDRDHEQDGPKFWRFKNNAKQDGVFDKIVPIIRSKGNIFDPHKGRDLIISLNLTKSNNGREYTSVSSIIQDDPSPLHADEQTAMAWLNDTVEWDQVFAKKGEDYLDLIVEGKTPMWDKATSKWVEKTSNNTIVTPDLPEDPQLEDDSDQDLPF